LVGIFALGAVALVTRSSEEEPASPATTRTTPAPQPPSGRQGKPILVDIDSKAVLVVYGEGLRAYNQGDYDTAIEALTQVVDDIPNNPAAMRFLGLAYYRNGEFEDAMDRLEEAHELRPHSFALMADYVSVCKEGGDVERALLGLERFVADHVVSHNGTVELEETAEGASFVVRLPLLSDRREYSEAWV